MPHHTWAMTQTHLRSSVAASDPLNLRAPSARPANGELPTEAGNSESRPVEDIPVGFMENSEGWAMERSRRHRCVTASVEPIAEAACDVTLFICESLHMWSHMIDHMDAFV